MLGLLFANYLFSYEALKMKRNSFSASSLMLSLHGKSSPMK